MRPYPGTQPTYNTEYPRPPRQSGSVIESLAKVLQKLLGTKGTPQLCGFTDETIFWISHLRTYTINTYVGQIAIQRLLKCANGSLPFNSLTTDQQIRKLGAPVVERAHSGRFTRQQRSLQ